MEDQVDEKIDEKLSEGFQEYLEAKFPDAIPGLTASDQIQRLKENRRKQNPSASEMIAGVKGSRI